MLDRYRKSSFMKGFVSLSTGSAVAQLIPLALSPYISRHFSIEEVGLFGIYTSLVSTLAVVIAGKYDMTVILPKSEEDSIRLVFLAALVSIFTSLFAFIAVMLFGDQISILLRQPDLQEWLWLVPISLFATGAYQAVNYWLIRQKAFKASALNKVAQRAVEGSAILRFGVTGMPGGLLVADVVGRCGMLLVAFVQAIRRGLLRADFSMSDMRRLMVDFKEYPGNYALSSLANSAAMHIPILFISNAYLAVIAGYFNLMKYVLSAPVAFISRNIAQVFLERLAEKWREGKPVTHDFLRMSGVMGAIALAFIVPILAYGDDLFAVVFGEKWREAGQFAQIMVFSFGIKFVVSPLSSLLNAINKVTIASWWQWAYFLLILTLIPAAQQGWSIKWFLIYYTAAESLAYAIYWLLIFSQARRHDAQLS